MSALLEGKCACGAVHYRLNARPLFVHCCHCLDCQRQTGSAFIINMLIEADQMQLLSGGTQSYDMPTDSGYPHVVHRCSLCQTALWSTYGGRVPIRFVRAGTLENPAAVVPDVHIYVRSKLPWITLPADRPAFETYYSMKTYWPADSLERRRAALEKVS